MGMESQKKGVWKSVDILDTLMFGLRPPSGTVPYTVYSSYY